MLIVLFRFYYMSYNDFSDVYFRDYKMGVQGGKWQSQDLILVDFCKYCYYFKV